MSFDSGFRFSLPGVKGLGVWGSGQGTPSWTLAICTLGMAGMSVQDQVEFLLKKLRYKGCLRHSRLLGLCRGHGGYAGACRDYLGGIAL